MKINLEGWKPFNPDAGQWYSTKERPEVMSILATILATKATSTAMKSFKDRYFKHPYENASWYKLDGELALLAQEVLDESL
jgi:hypothetical protein